MLICNNANGLGIIKLTDIIDLGSYVKQRPVSFWKSDKLMHWLLTY